MSSRSFLLVDFGATHVKSAIWTTGSSTSLSVRVDHSPPAISKAACHYEIPLQTLHDLFGRLCSDYERDRKLSGIFLCSQMHGFAVLAEDGRPLTDYISWKDERSLEHIKGESTFTKAEQVLGDRYRLITGMRPRPGFPFFNLLHLARENSWPSTVRVVSLTDWLSQISGSTVENAHSTMLAGLGLWDLDRRTQSEELALFFQEWTGRRFQTCEAADEDAIAGTWNGKNGPVPIYVGLGDHPCALFGAGLDDAQTVSLNIATGSQVSRIHSETFPSPAAAEQRPYIGKRLLDTITHIPAGRALEVYLALFAEAAGSKDLSLLWKQVDALTLADVEHASLDIDLTLFHSAWNYNGNASVKGVTEQNWTLKNFLASLVRSLSEQYRQAIGILDPGNDHRHLLFSGGLARKLSVLPKLFHHGSPVKVTTPAAQDETLLGLQRVASHVFEETSLYAAAPAQARGHD